MLAVCLLASAHRRCNSAGGDSVLPAALGCRRKWLKELGDAPGGAIGGK